MGDMKELRGVVVAILVAGSLWVVVPPLTTAGSGQSGRVVINELLASNGSVNKDAQGQYDDWIELYNRYRLPTNVGGWYLTDDPAEARKWRIPAGTTLPAGGYLLIWADGDTDATGLHASFKLGSDAGGVYLFADDGVTLLDSIEYGPQSVDVSYGRAPDADTIWGFMQPPTPGAANAQPAPGKVAEIEFSHQRGFYDAPFDLSLTCETPGAAIYYTLDGRPPCDLVTHTPTGTLYAGPVRINTTTCVRACALKTDWLAGAMAAHTYIFLEDVRNQATDPVTGVQIVPEGLPAKWPAGSYTGAVAGDYQVDPDVVAWNGKDKFGGLYARSFTDDMKAVPTVSLFMGQDDWFDTTRGIYVVETIDGTERACSLEWIDPNGKESFQINCAIAMQGGVSGGGTSLDRWKSNKVSMRPRFKTTLDDGTPTGGPAQLKHRLFDDSPTEVFDSFVLDARLANAWCHPGSYKTPNYLEDQFVCDLHNALGGQSPHGRYVHLYINGLYWGMYWLHERPDNSWAAQTFGGDKEQYDCLKHGTSGDAVNDSGAKGSAAANFRAMTDAAGSVGNDPAKYNAFCRMLDIDNFITDLLVHWFSLTMSGDWPNKNWYATHRAPDGVWRFHVWDAEHAFETWQSADNRGLSVSGIHDKLKGNAEYRMRFADLAHKAFFNGGALSYPAVTDRYRTRMAEIDRAIVGESARWGDTRMTMPGTRADWLANENKILTTFFPTRSDWLLGWLKSNKLYPDVNAPVFNIDGVYQHGGHTPDGAVLSMQAATGTIWYTVDGSDPRLPASTVSTSTVMLVAETAPKKVLVPTAAVDAAWRGAAAFDDSAWTSGAGGVGYENQTGYESFFSINVGPQMNGKNATCYIRIPFTVAAADLGKLSDLVLSLRVDDGFIAYINGAEVARMNFTGPPAWNSTAGGQTFDQDAIVLTPWTLPAAGLSALHAGENILALQGLNESTTSSDFLISAELKATKGSGSTNPAGVAPTAVKYTRAVTLPASAVVKARALSGATWSALNEATYAVGPVAQNLRISEIMYHPIDTGDPNDPNTEYLELTNIGTARINLNLVRFTQGVDFVFGDVNLDPNAYLLIVKDVAAFTARYGDHLPIAGPYGGSLSNAGERIELQDAAGQVIESFSYKDKWYDLTDGKGYSLTVKTADLADPNRLNDKSSWRPSAFGGGSPGYDDTPLLLQE